MPVLTREYTAILIVNPELNEEAVSSLQSQFGESVARHGGRVVESSSLGRRKFSYRIKRFSDGIFLQVRFQAPPSEIAALKKTASMEESIIRLSVLQEDIPVEAGRQKVEGTESPRDTGDPGTTER